MSIDPRLMVTRSVFPKTLGEPSSAPCINSNDISEKPKQKSRRRIQKPGKTAKMNDRHFVVHNYHDHAAVQEENDGKEGQRKRGGVAVSFPLKLHNILDQVEADGLAHTVSWQPHGRCFKVHKPKEFVEHVMPKYFRQTKLTSFQRQLNLYGFSRLTRGPDEGGYYHELFLRGKLSLCQEMVRTKVKGTKFKAASNPDQEPNFYAMPPVLVNIPIKAAASAASTASAASAASTTSAASSAAAAVSAVSAVSAERIDSSMQMDTGSVTGTRSASLEEAIPAPLSLQQQAQLLEQLRRPRFNPFPSSFSLDSIPAQVNLQQQAHRLEQIRNPYSMMGSMGAFPLLSQDKFPLLSQEKLFSAPKNYADRVLDEAVDQLFFGDGNDENLNDFRAWDLSNSFEDSNINDTQLGLMLEKLIEEK